MKKLILSLLIITMLTGCVSESVKQEEVTTTKEEVVTTAQTTIKTTVSETTTKQITEPTFTTSDDYVYQIPECVEKIEWDSENILCEVEYTFYRSDSEIGKYVDDFVVSDMTDTLKKSDYYMNRDSISWIGIMEYDLSGDGISDLITQAQVISEGSYSDEPNSPMHWKIYKIYIADSEGGYKAIDRNVYVQYAKDYILSTKTNGLNDFMVLTYRDTVSKYDGENSYFGETYTDEKYFIEYEKVDEKRIKVTLRMHGHISDESSYVAIRFKENDFLAENILYCCQSDGTPVICDENNPTNAFTDGYVFYMELTEEGIKAFTDEAEIRYLIDLSEIKYVKAE